MTNSAFNTISRRERIAARAFAVVAGLLLAPHIAPAQDLHPPALASGQPKATHPLPVAYGRLPLAFEANLGQADPRVQFLARGLGYTLLLTGPDATLRLLRPNGQFDDTLQLHLVGARHAAARGDNRLESVTNYYIGNDPQHWHTNVPNFSEVTYEDVYPGVGLRYYGKQGALENDLVIAPGADPGQIRLAIDGARSLRLDDDGNLVIAIAPGAAKATERHVLLGRPEIYQVVDGKRRKVAGGFVMLAAEDGAGEQPHPREIGFTLGDYDHTLPLVIDPTLSYSYSATGGYSVLYGAMSTTNGPTLNVDSAGEAVLVGVTLNSVLQTTANATQTTCAAGTPQGNTTCDGQSIYIEKFNATGTALTFATYFGGATENGIREVGPESTAIGTLDANDNIYVTGQTNAIDFPTEGPSGALQTTVSGNYLCKFYGTGQNAGQLEYSTYLGASDMIIYAVAADSSGNAYVGGTDNTGDNDFPISQNAPPLLCPTTCQDGFILGVEPDGSGYMYGAYVGGSQGPMRNGILAASASVQALASYSTGGSYLAVGALTSFTDMPLTTASYAQAVQTSGSGYVALLDLGNTGASQYLYASYLGGPGAGITAVGLAPGPGTNNLNLYAAGQDDPESNPLVLPVTPGAFEPLPDYGFPEINGAGPGNAYVASFSYSPPASVVTNYISYLGGSADQGTTINAITGDPYGDTWVAGTNSAGDFPLLNPLPALGECSSINSCNQTGFVTEINPNGTELLFSTFLGGNTDEVVSGLALDSSGNVYAAGWTQSPNFPVTSGSPQSSCGTGSCVQTWFVTKLAPQQAPAGPNLTFTLNGPTGSSVPGGGTINFPPTFDSFTQSQVITVNNTASSGANLAVTAARTAYTYIAPTIYYNDYTVYPYEAGSTTGDLPCMTISLTPVSISPNASCDMTVSWTPQGGGGQESSLIEIFDDAANISSPQYFYLNGTAVNGSGASVTPSLLSFGNVLLGSTLTENFTITSTGNQALDFNTPTFSLSGSSDFSISSTTCGTSLGAAYSYTYTPYSCTVSINYSAMGNGGVPESATLSVSDNSALPASPQTATATATTNYPEPQLVLVPASVATGISFPATAQGLPSGTTSFRIENEGNATLQFIVPIIVSGGNSADFHESDTCGANNPLPVYESCTVSLYFQPTQASGTSESTNLLINNNDPTTPSLNISLSGQSATPPGPPSSLPFLTSTDNSVPPEPSTAPAGLPAISNGGQFVAFFDPAGYSSGLSSNLPNSPTGSSGASGLYLRNTCAGPNPPANCTQSTQFIAYNPSGAPCFFSAYGSPGANLPPAISSDGRFVAFNDYNCFTGSPEAPEVADVFLRDTQGQTTTQITDQGGTPITGGFSMSANAEYFGFASDTEAVNRGSGDTSWQAYLNITGFSYGTPMGTPATLLVSQDNNGNADGSYNSEFFDITTPAVSPDGRFVAFSSPWNDLTGGGPASDGSSQVYLRDSCVGAPQGTSCTPKTIRISSSQSGNPGTSGRSGVAYSYNGKIYPDIAVSAGGRYVAFTSSAQNLPQPANGNGSYPVKVYLVDTCQSYGVPISSGSCSGAGPATPVLLSSAAGGTTPAADSFAPQISVDGRIVSFLSFAQLTSSSPATSFSYPYDYLYDTCISNGQAVTTTPACVTGVLGVISSTVSGSQSTAASVTGAVLDGSGQFAAYTSNASTSEIWLNGTTAPPATPAPVVLLPPSTNFGSLAVGTPSAAMPVVLMNIGNANLTMGTLALSGTNVADFKLSGDACSGETIGWVVPNNTCSVSVTFTPSLSTGESATLNFPDNAGGSPQMVGLSGTGTGTSSGPPPALDVSLNPSMLPFPQQLIGTTSDIQGVLYTNLGTAQLTLNNVQIVGPNAGDFNIVPGSACVVNSVLNENSSSPPLPVVSPATLTTNLASYASQLGNDTQNSALNVQSIVQQAQATSSQLQQAGTNSGFGNIRNLTLQPGSSGSGWGNTSNTALEIGALSQASASAILAGVAISRAGNANSAANAAVAAANAASSDANSANNAAVAAASAAAGAAASATDAELLAECADDLVYSGSQFDLPFGGIQPGTQNFGSQGVGTSSIQQLTYTNLAGYCTAHSLPGNSATISSITITPNNGTPAGDFSETDNCTSAPIAALATCTIAVNFTPSTTQPESATLTISGAAAVPVTLTGAGLAPGSPPVCSNSASSPIVAPNSVNFVNPTPGLLETFTVANTSCNPLEITSLGTTGADASDFSANQGSFQGLPDSLPAGGTAPFYVSFVGASPAASQPETATLNVGTSVSGVAGTFSVPLSASVTAPYAQFSAGELDFGTQPSGTTSAPMTLTLANSGATATGPLMIYNAAITSASYYASSLACTLSGVSTPEASVNPFPLTLNVGDSCTWTITYTNSGTSTVQSGLLSILDNAAQSNLASTNLAALTGGQTGAEYLQQVCLAPEQGGCSHIPTPELVVANGLGPTVSDPSQDVTTQLTNFYFLAAQSSQSALQVA